MNTEAQVFEALADTPDLVPLKQNLNIVIVGEMRPQIDHLGRLNERLTLSALETPDRINLGILQRDIAAFIAEFQPQLDRLKVIVADMYDAIRQLRGMLAAHQATIYQRLSVKTASDSI